MKKHKICKILLVILAIFLCVAFYELLGICVAYKKQPEVSNTTKKETKNGSWNECSENTERAVIIEKNPEALLQRVRLIKNAKKEIILSTFAFQSDESGKLILGALHDAADRGVHIRLLVDGMESWIDMEGNPYFYGLSSHENVEIKLYNKANPLKPWKMMGRMHDKYLIADGKRYILGGRNTYNYFLGDFPGHKNYDRDVLVVCDEPEKENSVNQLSEYFETIWNQEDSGYFHNNKKLANRKSVKNAVLELQNSYQKYFEENKERICETNYTDETFETEKITLVSNPIHTGSKEPVVWYQLGELMKNAKCETNYTDETFETEKITLVSNPIHTGSKEPVVWYQLGELMKNAKNRVKIHTPYIICNDMMYNTWEEIAENVSDFSIMTNSVANNGNPFGAADYAKNRNRILSTGINIWEYEGGYSYHGKSILIDDDLSVIGSFNMDMRSAYLDTELMLVIRSKDINKQLEEGMMEYEKVSRQILEGGTYNDPYHVEPIELTKKRQRKIFLVQHLLGWARYLF
ncbi:phospholipase D family protein [Blautia massiliensis (ex Durand et al. 2017)]|nr:phospholipase D family protein [Blautia massiliensis (ex Durand et al. 2017)]